MPEGNTRYDEVHYPSYAYRATHPDNLATIARLLGVAAADPRRCRVLELGCASGGNLMPMAFSLPASHFLGIDLSASQIEAGRTRATALGLDNLELRTADLATLELGDERWDYILCHGVYSWVPEPVRDAILRLCARHLAPAGVACISYNVYPGWHEAEGLLRMLRYHDRPELEPLVRVERALTLLEALPGLLDEADTRRAFIESERNRLRELSREYMLFEYLEGDNRACYFHEFVDRAASHGLQYLGNGRAPTMLVENHPEPVAKLVSQCETVVQTQQYLDLLDNRRFRTTLLVHRDVRVDWNVQPEWLEDLYLRADVEPEPALDDAAIDDSIDVASRHGSEASVSGVVRVALSVLRAEAPRALSWDELLGRTRERLRRAGGSDWQESPERDHQLRTELSAFFTRLYLCDVAGIHAFPAEVTNRIGERPKVTALARDEAERGHFLTGQWHECRWRDAFTRELVRRLDGRRDRSALVAELQQAEVAAAVAPGWVTTTAGAAAVPTNLEGVIDFTLELLRRDGFLID